MTTSDANKIIIWYRHGVRHHTTSGIALVAIAVGCIMDHSTVRRRSAHIFIGYNHLHIFRTARVVSTQPADGSDRVVVGFSAHPVTLVNTRRRDERGRTLLQRLSTAKRRWSDFRVRLFGFFFSIIYFAWPSREITQNLIFYVHRCIFFFFTCTGDVQSRAT